MSRKPSSNWLALQKSLVPHGRPWKRHKRDLSASLSDKTSTFPPLPPPKRRGKDSSNEHVDIETTETKNGEPMAALRRMVLGKIEYKSSQAAPGKYLALDCEMVGVGIEGSESSLARVSIVNYAGAVVLDVFVRQREKVIDYRTQWSGVRSTDLVGSAKPFTEVQQTVADLIKDRILVGHAIYNDLKALLLSHPSPQIRDTQSLAYKYRIAKSRRPALRVLVRQELDVVIQDGEHNSVMDARATMALFRLYKKQWESGFRSTARAHLKNKVKDYPDDKNTVSARPSLSPPMPTRKRKFSSESDDDIDEAVQTPSSPPRPQPSSPSSALPSTTLPQHASTLSKHSKQRRGSQPSTNSVQQKGISSGILTVTRRAGGIKNVQMSGARKSRVVGHGSKGGKKIGTDGDKWWKSLGGGKKGSIKL